MKGNFKNVLIDQSTLQMPNNATLFTTTLRHTKCEHLLDVQMTTRLMASHKCCDFSTCVRYNAIM